MLGKLIGWDDTIVALATPPGVGAIGVIRISGKKTFEIIDELFPSKKISQQPSHTLHVGNLKDDHVIIDEVVISIFKNPKSYTGEDVIEISCHGSPFVQEKIIQSVLKNGARLAKPGEFTQRAFLNGKLDLTQAEAVADLIASNSHASHKTALHNMRGGFSEILRTLREKLLSFSALIELELDFSQEDVEFADRRKFYDLITEATQSVNQLINSFSLGNVIKNGIQVAIVGKPNSGKSTLLNALLNDERAIVSEIAGTTRDTIEEVINIDGILFRLIDTAGIREHAGDAIESIGIERSLAKIQMADIVVYLFDATENVDEVVHQKNELQKQNKIFLLVANKIDLLDEQTIKSKFNNLAEVVLIAAKSQKNIETLKEHLVETVLKDKIQVGDTVITNERHLHALQKISQSLSDIKKGLDEKLSGDLIAPDIRQCLYYLGEITGEITNEDQLDYIFSKFCIGK
ncbi:MAG TPA: tRNA uridine-5-carboxymethylaminomethyl(34) synthesis GTPase MnmE [Puia sp.]|nr:tRNA uridine-5-carboxymethylaminomethyl(34) synthesis GTPase MnmE [Puia sp.]